MSRRVVSFCVLILAASACNTVSPTGADPTGGDPTDDGTHPAKQQVCTLASSAVGKPAIVVCKDIWTGGLRQAVPVGDLSVGPGGVGGVLSHRGHHVLVTGLVGTAKLFTLADGMLVDPVSLEVGADSLSGTLDKNGAYVLTGKEVLFFPWGSATSTSKGKLKKADGSAAQVATTPVNAEGTGYVYVSEKTGSLEGFDTDPSGEIIGEAEEIEKFPAGVVVGITSLGLLAVAPVAHLASAPGGNGSSIPVVEDTSTIANLPTRELAACWADSEDGEICITNPGSMTVSCGQFGPKGFTTFTSIANTKPLVGDTLLDIAMEGSIVGVLGKADGKPALFLFERTGDFVKQVNQLHQFPVGYGDVANGVILLSDREKGHHWPKDDPH
jgi:hypothetical protein